ncbi:hypothetical protein [Microlunatus parietis]|uniref:AAA domain-containing protein n=1 Tax=Microlunatus parietis TaxID=682979 RepID=A0A7Y9I8A0_9ACTN|nr:hypothetical protein [Microlunatus parietis]NYE72012.1 hypothetical protein [Microlunatus parietis]
MPTTLISVIGSPGSGKSTLCGALAERFVAAGRSVDHFAEEDILTRPAFADVATEFAGGAGSVRPATLIAATRRYLRQAELDGIEVLITDALLPYIPSLLAWGYDEPAIDAIVAELGRVAPPTEVIIVRLADDPRATLVRAADREGPAWLDWYVSKLRRSPGTGHVTDLDSAADHLRAEAELTRRALRRTGWTMIDLEVGERGPADLADRAWQLLAEASP